MDGISGIASVTSGMAASQMTQTAGVSDVGAGQSIASISSTSMSANIESFSGVSSAASNNNELLGAVLLMLMMQYMKSGDAGQKQDLLSVISALAQQQGQSNSASSTFSYSSTSISMESTQIQMSSTQVAAAYSGASATMQQVPAADAGSGSLNVIA